MRAGQALTEAFERFWAAYPARPDNPKAAARIMFERRVREGAEPARIAAAAARYAASVKARKVEAPFVPHARTWLSQRRWEDYPEPVAMAVPAADAAHPLAWLAAEIGVEAWGSWISRTGVEVHQMRVLIRCATGLAADRIAREWGELIALHYEGRTIDIVAERRP